MNIYSAVKEGTKILKKNFIKSAQLDSEILLAKAIDTDRKYILLNQNNIIDQKNLISFRKLINYRIKKNRLHKLLIKNFFGTQSFS